MNKKQKSHPGSLFFGKRGGNCCRKFTYYFRNMQIYKGIFLRTYNFIHTSIPSVLHLNHNGFAYLIWACCRLDISRPCSMS